MEAIEYDGLDPLLIAAIEDMFAALDPASFLDDIFDSQDPDASAQAFEDMVTGGWDEDDETDSEGTR
jgi:hypothetical protein